MSDSCFLDGTDHLAVRSMSNRFLATMSRSGYIVGDGTDASIPTFPQPDCHRWLSPNPALLGAADDTVDRLRSEVT
jgi:hypothetical protein